MAVETSSHGLLATLKRQDRNVGSLGVTIFFPNSHRCPLRPAAANRAVAPVALVVAVATRTLQIVITTARCGFHRVRFHIVLLTRSLPDSERKI